MNQVDDDSFSKSLMDLVECISNDDDFGRVVSNYNTEMANLIAKRCPFR